MHATREGWATRMGVDTCGLVATGIWGGTAPILGARQYDVVAMVAHRWHFVGDDWPPTGATTLDVRSRETDDVRLRLQMCDPAGRMPSVCWVRVVSLSTMQCMQAVVRARGVCSGGTHGCRARVCARSGVRRSGEGLRGNLSGVAARAGVFTRLQLRTGAVQCHAFQRGVVCVVASRAQCKAMRGPAPRVRCD